MLEPVLELALLFEADGGITGAEFLLADGDLGRWESFGTELLFVGFVVRTSGPRRSMALACVSSLRCWSRS
ncbi:hypothetical protein CDG81_13440 [Actinopolyspora erythraea]|uniref:Uncharacterized protein n=1 Tax=Actinopolyspora erythraea TaxID=414996 RepID=A0A099D475_9ACTN|nr:hypothetical protein [Actinopolyspora erythraea]ASU79124.1 hypothetical protein CDG81_13440 [Actinopolyspora erythraea]KGI80597.1 hypothetical protein IL38_16345 [Actinopolyspora erythraea]